MFNNFITNKDAKLRLLVSLAKEQSKDNSETYVLQKVPSLKEAFLANYKGNNKFLEDFENHVLKCSSHWACGQEKCIYCAPFCILFQSSGYDKTRIVSEFAKKHITLFFCLRDKNDSGYFPVRSAIAGFILLNMGESPDKANRLLVAMVTQALVEIEEIKQTSLELSEESIAFEFFKKQSWTEYANNWKNYDLSDDWSDLKKRFEQVMKIKEANGGFSLMSLTIALYESQCLTSMGCKLKNDVSLFTALSKAVRSTLDGLPIAFVFTSTNNNISSYNLAESQQASLQDGEKKIPYPPYTRLVTADILTSNETYASELKEFALNYQFK